MVGGLAQIDELVELPRSKLLASDIALLNLCAAQGLPGLDDINPDDILNRLDEWAYQVQFEIVRHLYRLDPNSSEPPTEYSYGNSLPRFIYWFLLQVLQEDCGVEYHPDRKFNPDFCQPQDLFIHGIVSENGQGGTCASMPVVYVAVGQRMGLPISLVETKGHLFFRWDDATGTTLEWENPKLNLWVPPDRFNVEGAGEGIAYYDDAYYMQWPELWNEADADHGRYLRSLANDEAFASFLVQRAECLAEVHKLDDTLKSIFLARKLVPEDSRYEWLHAKRSEEWDQQQKHIAEMKQQMLEHDRRERMKTPGHETNCQCHECRHLRRTGRPMFTEHHENCRCPKCQEKRDTALFGSRPDGHWPGCLCDLCQQWKAGNLPQHGQPPGFGAVPGPHHRPPPLPGFQQPTPGMPPQLPGFQQPPPGHQPPAFQDSERHRSRPCICPNWHDSRRETRSLTLKFCCLELTMLIAMLGTILFVG